MDNKALPGSDLAFRVDPGMNGPEIVIIDDTGRGMWLTVESLDAINKVVAECPPFASICCPHCGTAPGCNVPHWHYTDRKGNIGPAVPAQFSTEGKS